MCQQTLHWLPVLILAVAQKGLDDLSESVVADAADDNGLDSTICDESVAVNSPVTRRSA
jgi:hypothetical protein